MTVDVLVVGASTAGLGVVEGLRRKGFPGSIQLVGAEDELPYDRPPLSKKVLSGEWPPERALLRDDDRLDDLCVHLVLGRRAVGLDVDGHRVELADGWRVGYRTLVVATGLVPRRLPFGRGLSGVHTVRTLHDSALLRSDLLAARGVVVIGAGVLGCEIAATARGMDLDVTVVDPLPTPMQRHLGPELGGHVAALHVANGVRMRTGTPATGLVGKRGRVVGVRLGGGEVVPADVVVVAIGSTPATEWLTGSGVALDDGVVCDSRCRAAPDVYAVGDVARWRHDGLGADVRLENRTNAVAQAAFVAGHLSGTDQPYTPVPYFWTDQHDTRIQVHGWVPAGADVRVVDGSPGSGRFVALAETGGEPVGVIGWNSPAALRAARAAHLRKAG
ncbi:MAG TPA: FAD-dependent oxidoreductase [Umezawaea sp.]|nr:FAD-dependent oxidoreductase [Umezawaea sp.]